MLIEHLKAAVKDLGASNDLASIKSALHALCSEFGVVKKLDVLLARLCERRQALCFLRMEDTVHQQQIMQHLEVTSVSGYLVVIVNLPPESAPPRVGAAKPVGALAMA